jgi:hypothetical protein
VGEESNRHVGGANGKITAARSYADHVPAKKPRPRTGHPSVGADHPDDERRPTRAPSSANAAVEDTAGAMAGACRLDELETLREDWPA